MLIRKLFVVRTAATLFLFTLVGCGLDGIDLDSTGGESSMKGPAAILVNIDGLLPQFHIAPELLSPTTPSQFELENLLEKAGRDPLVRELIVHIGAPTLSFARAGELADALKRFNTSGKALTCHIDSADNVSYWMAARACPKILISPAGSVDAIGISLEQVFFKDLLDSLGLRADVLSVGKYKDAAEPFLRNDFSPESKEALESLLGEINDIFVGGIASNRKLTLEKTKALIDGGPYNAEDAVRVGLADQVIALGTHLDVVRKQYPAGIVDDYGRTPPKPIDFQDIIKLFGDSEKEDSSSGKSRIAVVPAIGPIASGPSEEVFGGMDMVRDAEMVASLSELARDKSVKAVVLRIDSPGGSALASDNIWHAVRALGKKKPVVASMGDVAASGGYYIASAATETMASGATITGSIGVIGGKLVIAEGAERVGIRTERIEYGKVAGIFSPFQPFDENGRKALMRVMKQTYDLFVDRVVEGRGMEREKVRELSEGRVWTGSQAVAHGLVNREGGLRSAIDRARELAKVSEGTPAELYPRPKNFFELLGESLGNTQVGSLQFLAEEHESVRQALAISNMLKREQVLAVTPFFFDIN